MVRLAIAGGTGAIGRTILDSLEANVRHEAVILSRKESIGKQRVVQVDYQDISALQSRLEENNVEVVIATFHMSSGALQAQLNLIEAASRSKCTKRFIPTSFAIPYPAG